MENETALVNIERSNALTAANFTCSAGIGFFPDGRVYGWVSQPNARGTADIVWTSTFTILVATFTILCLNVPSRGERWYGPLGRKVLWMALAIFGPEFVLTMAAGQFASAKRSVEAFADAGYHQWTLRHAFFADMGGIELNARDSVPFRVNAQHLHWLVANNVIEYPEEITLEEIWDKSKQDTIAKFITIVQICYLVIQCACRGIQGIAITTLELFALAIVICTIPTSYCWMHKPTDIKLPIRVYSNMSIAQILTSAGKEAARPYEQTPMDFVDDLKPSWSLNILTFVNMPVAPFERPISRFGNERFPDLKPMQSVALSVTTLLYAGLHLLAWDWSFPSRAEAILWRASSLIILASTSGFWAAESIAMWWRNGGGERYWYEIRGKTMEFERLLAARKARSEKPAFPLKSEFWVIFWLGMIYGAARLYLFVEAFWGLRSLEPSAYSTVNWMTFVPHI